MSARSSDERLAELESRMKWLESRVEPPLAGEFTDSASSPSDDLYVVSADWDDRGNRFGPVRWSPIGGALPQAGDEAVIVERSDGVWQVVAWWSDSQDTGAAQSAVDAIDTRVDVLEAIRTGGARINAGNPPSIVSQTGAIASVTRQAAGITRVVFNFNGSIYVSAVVDDNSAASASVSPITTTPATVDIYTWNAAGAALDRTFQMLWRA